VQPNSLNSASQFRPQQLVCLEHEHTFLYGEVIQVIPQRKICWVRPLMLVIMSKNNDTSSSCQQLHTPIDLRWESDLILPIDLFRFAIDTEIIPLLVQLENLDNFSKTKLTARQHLHHFLKQICQAHREIFQKF
jgi:hypothetical protein